MNSSDISAFPVQAEPAAVRDQGRAAPIAKAARIEAMDVIRGLALFGVLAMNLAYGFRIPVWGIHPRDDRGLDHIVMRIETALMSNKAMTLFSMLFGVGLAIFLERARARGPGAKALLGRRLLWLAVFGLAHTFLVWHGDILTTYALVGLLALALIDRSGSVLCVAIAVSFAFTSLGPLSKTLTDFGSPLVPGHYEEALRVYGTGSYLDTVRFRAYEAVRLEARYFAVNESDCLTNMLVGVLVWRSGVLRHPERHLRTLRWTCAGGIAIGLGYAIFRAVYLELQGNPPPSDAGVLRSLVWAVTVPAFAIGYGSGALLLLQRADWRKRLALVAPLGRMAFTNYLVQSLVFTTLFYGYGFGLLGKVGYAGALAMGIAFYILQGIISTFWLRHFAFGPFEWAWRSLTYWKLQPFRASARKSPVPTA